MKVTRMKFFADGHTEELITETPAPAADSRDTAALPLSAEERRAIMRNQAGLNINLAHRYEATLVALEAQLTARAVRAEECERLISEIGDVIVLFDPEPAWHRIRALLNAHAPRPATP